MRISDWSSDVCSSDLLDDAVHDQVEGAQIFTVVIEIDHGDADVLRARLRQAVDQRVHAVLERIHPRNRGVAEVDLRRHAARAVEHEHDICLLPLGDRHRARSEEHTSELQSLMRISYAVFCLKKKTKINSYN